MSSLPYITLLGVAFGVVFCVSYATGEGCVKQQEKCQNCSADFFTTKLMLSSSKEVREEVVKAHNTIMQSGADKVVKLFSQYTLTTSLNYFCCLTNEEKKIIAESLQTHPGATPQSLTYHGADCMESSDGIIIMLMLNGSSQEFLKKWVNNVSTYLESKVEVVHRSDPFGLQLALVNDDYPLDDALAILNNISFNFEFNRFFVSGVIIHLS